MGVPHKQRLNPIEVREKFACVSPKAHSPKPIA
jgi:hypothetical protein